MTSAGGATWNQIAISPKCAASPSAGPTTTPQQQLHTGQPLWNELLHLILLSAANTNWLIVPAVATRRSALASKGGICVPKPVQESRKESSWRQAEPARTSLTSVRQVSKEFCHL